MWMDREIQQADFIALICTETYLKRVEGRESPGKGRGVLWEATLIYNLLYAEDTTIQRFIPILLDGGTEASIPLPLRGLTHYQAETDQGYEDFYRHLTAQPRHEQPALGKLKALHAIEPQSYPASLKVRAERKAPTSLDQRNRLQMLKRVRLDWIDGVLKQSLYQIARIELGLQTKSDAVEQPLKTIVQAPDRLPTPIPAGTSISQAFDDLGSALLIMGAPGTGKTTLLLELAEQLIDRAEQNETHPIPVVFNLSSWAVRRQPLDRWLVSELNERSDVPKTLAQRWLETEQIIPLLDGLDEVSAEHRQACVEVINNFRRDHGLLPIAVCSRIADYQALGVKLRLRTAVVVQPLIRPEVQNYLDQIGAPLQGLRAALDKDATLWEILETPLMLWVAMLAYRNAPVEFSRTGGFEQRRRRLFANFVNAMFMRRSLETGYTQAQYISWLRWLASALKRNKQTVFYLENLSAQWLSKPLQRWLTKAVIVVANALAGMLIGALVGGLFGWLFGTIAFGLHRGLRRGLIGLNGGFESGVVLGPLIGLIGTFVDLKPAERMRITLSTMSFRLRRAVRGGLKLGLGFAVMYWILLGLIPEMVPTTYGLLATLAIGMLSGLFAGLALGLLCVLAFALVTLPFVDQAVETRKSPNQGTRRSARMALTIGPIGGLIATVAVGLLFETHNGLALLVVFSEIIGLIGGGLFAARHFAVRLMLWINRSAPLNYVRFLDHAVERLFLRRVGGGYIFVHRMLLEYFASLPE